MEAIPATYAGSSTSASHEDGSSSSILGSGRRSVATSDTSFKARRIEISLLTYLLQQMAGWHKMTRSLEGLFLPTIDSKDLSSLLVKSVDDWCMQEPDKQNARLSALLHQLHQQEVKVI